MLDKSPRMDSLGPKDDLRSSYMRWQDKHARLMQEPPKEGCEYINHVMNVLPFIEAASEANPIAKG